MLIITVKFQVIFWGRKGTSSNYKLYTAPVAWTCRQQRGIKQPRFWPQPTFFLKIILIFLVNHVIFRSPLFPQYFPPQIHPLPTHIRTHARAHTNTQTATLGEFNHPYHTSSEKSVLLILFFSYCTTHAVLVYFKVKIRKLILSLCIR